LTEQTQPKQQNNNHDSSKVCHIEETVNIGFSGVRKHTSFRCDSKLWKEFKKVCKKNGLSTCNVLEKLILGFIFGLQTRVAQPTTLTVVVDAPRVVKRVRRRQLIFEDEVGEGEGCWYCGRESVGRFRYVKTGRVYPLCSFHAGEFLNGKTWVEVWEGEGDE